MTKEALNLALEALETNNKAWRHLADSGDAGFWEAEEQPFYELSVKAITAIKEALVQPEPNYKKALEVWLDKTEWVQETVKPHELGMHRADVLKQRIEATLAQPEQLREENERLHVENRRLIDRIETIGVPVGVGGFATTTMAKPEEEIPPFALDTYEPL